MGRWAETAELMMVNEYLKQIEAAGKWMKLTCRMMKDLPSQE